MKVLLKKIIKKLFIYKCYVAVRKINKIIRQPSFFDEYERKNVFIRYYENYRWLLKYRRHNPSYNLYGLDVKGLRKIEDYVDIKYIRKDRLQQHHQNDAVAKHRKENIAVRYSLLADNKQVFYSFINSIDSDLVPRTFFVFSGNRVLSPLSFADSLSTKEALMKLDDGKYVSKAVIGAFGDTVTIIEKDKDKFSFNSHKLECSDFIESTKEEPYLIQEYINQHKEINKLNPNTVNTLRIISTRWNEETQILAAMIRIGVKDQIVDNASNGGTFVGIDVTSGKLMEYGYYYDKKRERKHPDTGTEYKDFAIPFWKETVSLIKKLHPLIFGLSSIGWDIAITEEGPKIVEINWNYSIKGIQIASGGIKKKWEEAKTL